MRQFLRRRFVVPAALGALALGGIVIVASTGNDGPRLTEARVERDDPTSTVSDLRDQTDEATAAARDGRDEAAGLTNTVTDLVEPATPETLSAGLAVDDASQCVWLVNVTDENPANLFLVVWPTATELAWGPFGATIPTVEGPLVVDARRLLDFDGTVRGGIGELTEGETERLLGLERCGHDGIVVFADNQELLVSQD